ncbi:LysR family transcriptional regulator [Kiloniella laminariae]|uniref:LysR family transcriptional regulator n=1 Tax=Kiloniella laminariae TaxID=454162 RepID=A0ABT4LJ35_9PROT|nr:LysR family transcriptional regulator [Kiloniella laminariae]MCZ4281091.1 LysR family transcriptional regulator [Kiloniella laminariae]
MDDFDRGLMLRLVVEQGTMAGAARALHVSPSVVSKRLVELENLLGVQLLRRTTRRISLTEAGEHFYNRMRFLGGEWQTLLEETASLGQTPRGKLTIAAPAPLLNRFLVPAIGEFMRRYPDIETELQAVNYDKLPLSQVDVSLARWISGFDSGAFVGARICRYHNFLFAAPSYLAARGEPGLLSDLSAHQCLCYGLGKGRTEWQFPGHAPVMVEGKLRSDNTDAIIAAAVDGQGIAYIPALIIEKELARGELAPVLQELSSAPFEMWAYYQQLEYVPLKLRVFLDFLKQKWN